MDAAEGIIACEEQDNRDLKCNGTEKEAVTDEPRAESLVENGIVGEDTADAESPVGGKTVQPVKEKKRTRSSEDETPASLPVTRVKRIIKLDPDIKLVSKEGIFAIIQATQHFLEALAAESISQAWKSKRKGVKADDIMVAARNPKFRDCLGTTLSDFVQHLRAEDSDDEDGGSAGESEGEDLYKRGNKKDVKRKFLQPPPGNRSITDFLKLPAER